MSLRVVWLWAFAGVALIGLNSCSSVSVVRADGSVDDLTEFDSYRWGAPPLTAVGRHDSDLLLQDQLMRQAVTSKMSPLGFSLKPFDAVSELIVDYQLRFNAEQYADIDQPEGGWVWRRDGEGELQRSRVNPDSKVIIDQMVLQLTVYDYDRRNVLWVAEASGLIDHSHPPKHMAQAIQQMVARLFKRFPKGKN